MAEMKLVPVGIVGTSWWADSMYLPALAGHPGAKVVALCGRDPGRAKKLAARWNVPQVFGEPGELIESGLVDALIVATSNDSHFPITMQAIEKGLHVLCEKPLALSYAQAAEMARAADRAGIRHMVPYTYRYMPTARFLKRLLDEGYIGNPYHLNLRYYTGYGRSDEYKWRFDARKAGAGAVGDIGSHFLYLAGWFFGEVTSVAAQFGYLAERPPTDPAGETYPRTEDTGILALNFANGAQGAVHVSILAHEPTPFGQTHHMDFHGSEGTLYSFTDWDRVQRVSGARAGEGPFQELPIPEEIWGSARRDTVHNTYRDIFRREDFMARAFISAILENKPVRPDFHDGARVQRLIEAAVVSDRERRWVEVESIQ